MTKFRHLIWMVIAAAGLMLSVSHSFAQQPDVGDQPGLMADDSVELDPEWQKQMVYYRTNGSAGHHHHLHGRAPSLSGAAAAAARCATASASAATASSGRAC